MKKKVLIFYPNLQSGGTERVIRNLVPELRQNYELSFLNLKFDPLLPVDVHQQRLSWGIPIIFLRYAVSIIQLLLTLIGKKTKIVCAYGEVPIVLCYFLKTFRVPIKYIANVRNSEKNHFLAQNYFGHLKMKVFGNALRHSCKVTANSKELCNEIRSEFNITKVNYIENPVAEHFFSLKPLPKDLNNSINIISVGRLVEQKAHKSLLRIVKVVQQKGYNIKLTIVGDGELTDELISLAEVLQIRDFSLLKFQKNIENIYQMADIFCLTSNWEGSPNVLLEAMSAGLPVVAFDCPTGPKEVLSDEVNGFLVELNNQVMFADRLIQLIKSENLRSSLGNAARKSMQKNRAARISKKWSAIIDGL